MTKFPSQKKLSSHYLNHTYFINYAQFISLQNVLNEAFLNNYTF